MPLELGTRKEVEETYVLRPLPVNGFPATKPSVEKGEILICSITRGTEEPQMYRCDSWPDVMVSLGEARATEGQPVSVAWFAAPDRE